MNKTSLLTILLSLAIGRVLHILDATVDTWAILASALSCSVASDWKICIEILHFTKGGFAFQHSRTVVAFAPTTES